MTKYEQIILKFKISDLKSDENRLDVQQELSSKGAAGFKLVNSHIHAAHEVNNDGFRYLFCIMEREYYEAEAQSADSTSDDDWDTDTSYKVSTDLKKLKPGTSVDLASSGQIKVTEELGRGGQGVVYLAEFQGHQYALKWYTQQYPDTFYVNLKNNIEKGAPSNAFLWPLMLTKKQYDSFGYVMQVHPPEYNEFGDFLLAKVTFASLTALLNTALQICEGYYHLHLKGYYFQTFSDSNLLINPQTGDVLICDNDNVTAQGQNTGIMGKARYMAPEIVSGGNPDKYSDYYSLSLILFLIFFRNHPLEGLQLDSVPCMTEDAEKKYYGSDALFIYDRENQENRPVQGVHENVINLWPQYPEILRHVFIDAFSNEKLKNPEQRITPDDWGKVIVQLKSLLMTDNDGQERFAKE
jgi:serine/threonine protein kinase